MIQGVHITSERCTLTPNIVRPISLLHTREFQYIPIGFRARIWPHLRATQRSCLDACNASFAHEAIGPELVGETCVVGCGCSVPLRHPGFHAECVPACGAEAIVGDVLAVGEGGSLV